MGREGNRAYAIEMSQARRSADLTWVSNLRPTGVFMEEVRFASQWKKRREDRRLRSRCLAEEARENLRRVVQVLTQQYGVRRIILFGSLTRGRFIPGSDIDLAVEGLKSADFYEAMAAVNRLTPLWVDLKPLEDLEPFFRKRVLRDGEVLFPERMRTDEMDGGQRDRGNCNRD